MSGDFASLEALALLCRDGWHSLRPDRPQPAGWRALAARHRVVGLAASEAGDSTTARAVVAQSLHQLAECRRLLDTLSPAEPLLLKGLAVAALGYDEPLLKQSADIDLLVSREHLLQAGEILSDLGYGRVVPSGDVPLERWHAVSNQSLWSNGQHRVELHHRPVPIDGLLDRPVEPTRTLTVGGVALPTLGDRDQFAYLAVHGGLSLWFRLKWLVDFAAFAERRKDQLAGDLEHANRLGAGRAAALALLLADRLFHLEIPEDIRPGLGSDWRVRLLARHALRMMQGGEPTERRFGTLPIHLASAMLAPSPRALVRRAADLLGQRRLA